MFNWEGVIPKGYRFNPTDEELITYYLRTKVNGENMTSCSNDISEQDLYGDLPPWIIFDDQSEGRGEDDCIHYCYTRLKKKHETGKMIHRMVGKNGEYCWDGQAKGTEILDPPTGTVIGEKKKYSFIRSNQKKGTAATNNNNTKKRKEANDNGGDKSFGNWIMHEYSLVNHHSSNDNQNYVLCRIKKKKPPKPSTRSNATSRCHGSTNSSTTTPALVLPYCTSTTHGQQQDHLPAGAADHVVVPPLVLPTGTDNQINHDQDQGHLWQHLYDHDQLFLQDVQQQQQQQQQQLVLMYDQEQPAATMEVSNFMVGEEENRFMMNNGGGTTSNNLDYSTTTMAAGGIDNFDNGWTGLTNSMMNLDNGRNNYDAIMNSLNEDIVYYDSIW